MKTRTKILIPTVVFLSIGLFYLYIVDNGFSIYSEGINLTLYSEDEFQKILKQTGSIEALNITKITDEDLKQVPVLKELIEQSQRQEFPLNSVGVLNSTLDEIKFNHDYVAQKYAVKYNTNSDSYFSTKLAHPSQLEEFPDSYWYEYDGRFFKYGDRYYSFYDASILVNYGEPYRIEVDVFKRVLTSDRLYVELTNEDWQHIPTVKEAIDKIGTLQKNIEIFTDLSPLTLTTLRNWSNNTIEGYMFEYDDRIYSIGFWIA